MERSPLRATKRWKSIQLTSYLFLRDISSKPLGHNKRNDTAQAVGVGLPIKVSAPELNSSELIAAVTGDKKYLQILMRMKYSSL
jgi:hypothetical protein